MTYRPVALGALAVAGLALAHQRHGKQKWAALVEPARRLAAEGFPLNHQTVVSLRANAELLARFPESKRILLRDGKLYEVGDRLVQPDVADKHGQ